MFEISARAVRPIVIALPLPQVYEEVDQVTGHGDVSAIIRPGFATMARYADLVRRGKMRLRPVTASDVAGLTTYKLPADALDPVEILLAEREDEGC